MIAECSALILTSTISLFVDVVDVVDDWLVVVLGTRAARLPPFRGILTEQLFFCDNCFFVIAVQFGKSARIVVEFSKMRHTKYLKKYPVLLGDFRNSSGADQVTTSWPTVMVGMCKHI